MKLDDVAKDEPLFVLLMYIAEADGVIPLSEHYEGCWERQLGEWWFAVNGHDGPRKCSHGVEVQPYHCYVEYNGFPAGLMTPFGGVIAAGRIANEDAFAEALHAELRKHGNGASGL